MNKQITIFEFLSALTDKKIDMTNNDRFEKDYSPYMINRFLSMHPSTIFYAHFANRITDKKNHFLFLLNCLEKEKIFLKYIKKDKFEDTKIIQKCYDISLEKARSYMDLISKTDLKNIRKKYGGKT